MFHYTTVTIGKNKSRGSMDIKVGDWVQSHYLAHWRGIVLELHPDGGYLTVKQMIDKSGNELRNKKIVKYHCSYFKKVDCVESTKVP